MKRNTGSPEDIFTVYLAQKGMKLTTQRRLIVKEFFQASEHMRAEDLYQRVRHTDPSVGQATVYRTLNLLRDAGLARELRFSNDVTIFEPRSDSTHHDHLICEECGKTVPVLDEIIEQLQNRLAEQHGFKLTSHRMYLYGICPDCRTTHKSGSAPAHSLQIK
jgi:Fur family ferric uptake transcriptional regulator